MKRSLLFASLWFAIPVYAAPSCPHIGHVEQVLKPRARIVLGEIHGNEETPRFASALACQAAKLGPVRVGLEIPKDEQARIDAFLVSGDRTALLAGPFWTDHYQDGRRSEAMVALLNSLHERHRRGADVKVVAFDVPGANREQWMADRLSAAFTAEPKATFVVLVGNLHARRTPNELDPKPMVERMVEKGVRLVSLKARYGDGTSWICTGEQPESCLPQGIGDGSTGEPAIALAPSQDGAYDGTFEAGAATFSPPAVSRSLTPAQKDRIETARLSERANRDYDHKRYRECATEFLALSASTLLQHDGTIAYSAASCYALAGERARAFATLSDAITLGYADSNHASADRDLASLHKDIRWRPLLDRMRRSKHASSHINPALRATLVKMNEDDQRECLLSERGDAVVSHGQERIALLKQIIAEYGWPGISLAGEDGAMGAWIVAQHADDDLPFQKQCLTLVEKAYATGDATGLQLAYLTDRVLTAEHKQQLYGTQGAPQFSPKEKAEVEARRKKLGLPTMAEMAREKGRFYEQDMKGR